MSASAFTKVPTEIKRRIADHFLPPSFPLHPTLVALSCVNKEWRLICVPLLFRDIRLKSDQGAITRFLFLVGEKYGNVARSLHLVIEPTNEANNARHHLVMDRLLSAAMLLMPRIRSFSITTSISCNGHCHCAETFSSTVDAFSQLDQLSQLSIVGQPDGTHFCPQLFRALLAGGKSRITKVALTGCIPYSKAPTNLITYLSLLQNLRHLRLDTLDLAHSPIIRLAKVEHLELVSYSPHTHTNVYRLNDFLAPFGQTLRTLKLENFVVEGPACAITSIPNLASLSLRGCCAGDHLLPFASLRFAELRLDHGFAVHAERIARYIEACKFACLARLHMDVIGCPSKNQGIITLGEACEARGVVLHLNMVDHKGNLAFSTTFNKAAASAKVVPSPPRPRPSLNTLPQELKLAIIDYLPAQFSPHGFQESPLVSLSSCNREWRLLSIPKLFRRVQIGTKSNGALSNFLAFNAARYASQHCKTLNIGISPSHLDLPPSESDLEEHCWISTRDLLLGTLLDTLPLVETLSFRIGEGYSTQFIDAPLTIEALRRLSGLTDIDIHGHLCDVFLPQLLDAAASAKNVAIHNRSQSIGYAPMDTWTMLGRLPNIKQLTLDCVPSVDDWWSHRWTSQLAILRLERMEFALSSFADFILQFNNSLWCIVLVSCTFTKGATIEQLSSFAPTTKKLVMSDMSGLSLNATLQLFATSDVKMIKMTDCSNQAVRESGLVEMLRQGAFPTLRIVFLDLTEDEEDSERLTAYVDALREVCERRKLTLAFELERVEQWEKTNGGLGP